MLIHRCAVTKYLNTENYDKTAVSNFRGQPIKLEKCTQFLNFKIES